MYPHDFLSVEPTASAGNGAYVEEHKLCRHRAIWVAIVVVERLHALTTCAVQLESVERLTRSSSSIALQTCSELEAGVRETVRCVGRALQ